MNLDACNWCHVVLGKADLSTNAESLKPTYPSMLQCCCHVACTSSNLLVSKCILQSDGGLNIIYIQLINEG